MIKDEFDINENRIIYKLNNLERSVFNLEKAINALSKTNEPELIKMAIIQYYEICIEVSHSFFVKYLQSLDERVTTDIAKKVVLRKIVANIGFEENDALILYKAIDVRNKTSHEYKDWYNVYGMYITDEYLPVIKKLINNVNQILITDKNM